MNRDGKFHRREFLGLSATSAFLSFLNPVSAAEHLSSSDQKKNERRNSKNLLQESSEYDCLILGAGMAGLTAARRLMEASKQCGRPIRIAIVEGSGRLGGRIFTSHHLIEDKNGKQVPIELGAEYIHRRPLSVPLWHDVRSMKAPIYSLSKISNSLMYHSEFSGEKLKRVFSLFGDSAVGEWGLFNSASLYSRINNYQGSNMSVEDWIQNQYGNSHIGMDMASLALTGDQPAVDSDISILGFKNDTIGELSSENKEYSMIQGYESLLTHLQLGSESQSRVEILYNSRINKIDYSHPEMGIKIHLNGGGVLASKTAICTFSIGMLKSEEVEFYPQLPQHKQDALKTIKLGHLSKFIIQFNELFWPKEMTYLLNPDSSRTGCRTYFNINAAHKCEPPVLAALVTGGDVMRLKKYSDREVTEMICADLDQMFPHKRSRAIDMVAQRPLGGLMVLRKQWADDPFAKGGTSYLSFGNNVLQARSDLAEGESTAPLFWAGEATALNTQPSTVHGAHESGIRTAQEVWNYLFFSNANRRPRILSLNEFKKDYQDWYFKTNKLPEKPIDHQTFVRTEWEELFGWAP